MQSTTFFLPSYSETATLGSNQFALTYASRNARTTRSEPGVRLVKDYKALTLKGRAAWAHDWFAGEGADATFQTLPGATFAMFGAQPSPNAALVSLGADYRLGRGWSVAANLDGEFSGTMASYAGNTPCATRGRRPHAP